MVYTSVEVDFGLFLDEKLTIPATILDMQKEYDEKGNYKVKIVKNENFLKALI